MATQTIAVAPAQATHLRNLAARVSAAQAAVETILAKQEAFAMGVLAGYFDDAEVPRITGFEWVGEREMRVTLLDPVPAENAPPQADLDY